MNMWYILEGHTPVAVQNVIEWGARFNSQSRIVKQTKISKDVRVSTIFLGMNHQFLPGLPPLVFETMVFGVDSDLEYERYSTWEQAEEGHHQIVEKLVGLS